jgi:hypothetical protein
MITSSTRWGGESMEKEIYIKQIKTLIKKYHPDLCNDENLESVYNEITIKLNAILGRLREQDDAIEHNGLLIEVKEQSYIYYRKGIDYYQNIHIDKLYKRTSDKTYESRSYDEQLEILNNIYLSFKLSEYYFNKVITEYKDSIWAEDAKEKTALLRKLYKRYENINIEEKIIDTEQFVQEMGLKLMP